MLPMKEDEIVMMYKQAKNQKKQIKILADMNLCGESEIIKILKAHRAIHDGAGNDAQGRKDAGKRKVPRIDYEAARELYDKGLKDREIAKAMQCSEWSIAMWRKKNGLKPNGTQGGYRGRKTEERAQTAEEEIREPETTEDINARIRALFNEGKTDAEIAELLNMGKRGIEKRRQKMGLYRQPPRTGRKSKTEYIFENESARIALSEEEGTGVITCRKDSAEVKIRSEELRYILKFLEG